MSKGIRRRPKSYYMSKAKRAYLELYCGVFDNDNVTRGARGVATALTYEMVVNAMEILHPRNGPLWQDGPSGYDYGE